MLNFVRSLRISQEDSEAQTQHSIEKRAHFTRCSHLLSKQEIMILIAVLYQSMNRD